MQSRSLLRHLRPFSNPSSLTLRSSRYLSTTHPLPSSSSSSSTSFKANPGPPRLPKKDQEEYEALTKASSFGDELTMEEFSKMRQKMSDSEFVELLNKEEEAAKHQDFSKRGEKPLFEGDRNPVTGEVGGPKTNPLKYGDWSYNGKVTDF